MWHAAYRLAERFRAVYAGPSGSPGHIRGADARPVLQLTRRRHAPPPALAGPARFRGGYNAQQRGRARLIVVLTLDSMRRPS
jgi:hypothetical protein